MGEADYALDLLDGGGGVAHFQACGLTEEVEGVGVAALEGGEDAPGIGCFGRVAGLGEE